MRFRGRSFMAFVLAPATPIAGWLAELDKWTRNSPDFFVGRPIILDLAGVALSQAGIGDLIAALGERGIRVMGLEGAHPEQLGPTRPAAKPSPSRPATIPIPSQQPNRRSARNPVRC